MPKKTGMQLVSFLFDMWHEEVRITGMIEVLAVKFVYDSKKR